MPQMSEGGEFKLRLHYCRAWHERSDLMQALEHLIHDLNLIPLYDEYKHDGMVGTKTLPAGEFASYIMQSYQPRDDWDRENFLGAFLKVESRHSSGHLLYIQVRNSFL
jgi:hypothetical protein